MSAMSNIGSLPKAEISRVTRQNLAQIESFRKTRAQQHSHITALRLKIQELERGVRRSGTTTSQASSARAALAADGEKRRFSRKREPPPDQARRVRCVVRPAGGASGQTIHTRERGRRVRDLSRLIDWRRCVG